MARTPEEKRAYMKEYSRKRRERLAGTEEHERRKARSRARYHERRDDAELARMRETTKRRYSSDRRLSLFEGAKRRAKLEGLPFSITIDDIIIPEVCPVLGIPIQVGLPANSPGLPSLDKFIPELGYVPGNITVISLRANSIKKNASIAEIEALYKWMLSFNPVLS